MPGSPFAIGSELLAVLADDATAVETNAVRIFANRLGERRRCTVRCVTADAHAPGTSDGTVLLVGRADRHPALAGELERLGIAPVQEPEGYVLHTDAESRTVVVCGGDASGVLYGLGRLLRALDLDGPTAVGPALSESSVPVGKQRGVYCATHFNNWYECCDLGAFERYVEDLALWGVNTLWTWFDMNWYPFGFWDRADSRGMRMVERIRNINAVARGLGMQVGLTGLANEGFRDQPPPELRVTARGWRGGFYPDSQICPSKPGGLALILENRKRVLDLIGPIDAFWYWPYDQGGCGCSDCMDEHGWGRKFLEIGPEVARVVRGASPGVRFVVSTWYFNDHEMELACREAGSGSCWFDGLLVETHRAGHVEAPAGCELSVFPEISMFDGYFLSYGCNGANPAPRRFVEQARRVAELGYGAVLYSEGCFEDINKVTWAASLWSPERTAEDIAEEYSRAYFGHGSGAAGRDLILGLETTWGSARLAAADPEVVASLHSAAEALSHVLPSSPGSRWRWQALVDRASIDHLMVRIGPASLLAPRIKRIYDRAGFDDDVSGLRGAVASLRDQLLSRGEMLETLFQEYRAHLRRFALDTVWLIFRPDEYLGPIDFAQLERGCDRALACADDGQMRLEFISAVHRWFWLNGIDAGFVFAPNAEGSSND